MHYIKAGTLNTEENLELIRKAIASDQVIIYPTDTLYGIGGNFLSIKAHKLTDTIKGRTDAPYSAAVDSIDSIKTLCDNINNIQRTIIEALLPGKVTLLLTVSPHLPAIMTKGSPLIGIRIPENQETIDVIRAANTPLITTSVNFSGEKSLNSPETIKNRFLNRLTGKKPVAMVESAFDCSESSGSTIVDISCTPGRLLRRGDDFNSTISIINRVSGWNLS